MRIYREKRRVPHAADKMFDLVAEMERYPEFLPFCQRNVVRSRRTNGDSEIVSSEMTVAFKIFCETFRSRVTLERTKGRILIDSADGLLRELTIRWTFSPVDHESCAVEFLLTYELASPTLAAILSSIIETAFSRFVEAFEHRADALYGRAEASRIPARERTPATA